jgi:hypothetical protein
LRFLYPRQDARLRLLCGFLAYWKGFQVIPGVLEHRSPQRLVSPPSNRRSYRIRSFGNFPVLLSIQNPLVVGCFGAPADVLTKPVRPIRKPPTRNPYRNRSRQRPPQRQRHIRNQPQQRERGPKDLLLHTSIVAPHAPWPRQDVLPATGARFGVFSAANERVTR